MAHFAKLNQDNVVIEVVVVNNDVITTDGVESEQAGIDFLTELTGHTLWKQASYNGNLRKNFPGVGFSYDENRNAFIAIQPHTSWILNETTCQWEPPVAYPQDENKYVWFEPNQEWVQV